MTLCLEPVRKTMKIRMFCCVSLANHFNLTRVDGTAIMLSTLACFPHSPHLLNNLLVELVFPLNFDINKKTFWHSLSYIYIYRLYEISMDWTCNVCNNITPNYFASQFSLCGFETLVFGEILVSETPWTDSVGAPMRGRCCLCGKSVVPWGVGLNNALN